MTEEQQQTWERAFGSGSKKKFRGPKKSEWYEHKTFAGWMKDTYPGIRFHTSLDGLAVIGKHLGALLKGLQWTEPGYPDIIVHYNNGRYTGLAIELKREGVKLRNTEHTRNQESWLEYLRQQGYKAEFCIGAEAAKKLTINFIKTKKQKQR